MARPSKRCHRCEEELAGKWQAVRTCPVCAAGYSWGVAIGSGLTTIIFGLIKLFS